MTTNKDRLVEAPDDEAIRRSHQRYQDAMAGGSRDMSQVLKAHLYTEHLLERIFLLRLPRGDKLMDGAALTYAQKLALVEALNGVPDDIAASLRALNKVRNQLVHELGRQISEVDLLRIGSPLGKPFTAMRKDAKDDPSLTLRAVANYLCGFLSATCHEYEFNVTKSVTSRRQELATESVSGDPINIEGEDKPPAKSDGA